MSHVKLGDLFRVGSSKRVLQSQWTTEGIPFYRGREITKLSESGFVENDLFITEELFKDLSQRSGVPQAGDLMITAIGTIGNSYIVCPDDRFYFKDASVLWLARNSDVSSEYINHWLKSPLFLDQLDRGNGATVDTLTIQKLQGVLVHVPSASEQRRIVTLLDEAFADIATAKANAEKNLQNARKLFESHLQAIFSTRGANWEDKTLEQISTTFGRGKSRHRPRNDPSLYGGKYPFIQTGDVRNAEHIITEFSQTYSEAGLAQSKLWPKGTICITIAANIAETGILGFDACFPDSVIGVVPNPNEAEVGYVEYVLQSFKARLQALGQGSAQANINMGTFENERFPFPKVEEQRRIVTKLDALSEESQRLESIYRQKLTALDDLKKSLLHQAFSGLL
ncbi:restriction endonuclease subunit S [Limnohabitans sp. TS-CS-82]|uniref:restriction endonuclease subunit S n=1 Tax=Limnohabitans sp. TS-CS-82 TaxID=2094193 RepID=UPI000CF2E1DC|nr:restriction endonuclease subunit S [Limnohabitans sp. TS-CS-82]PQA83849.1 restriction endonuclease subunit S [Limnohabitans sp. TS-CS-82]